MSTVNAFACIFSRVLAAGDLIQYSFSQDDADSLARDYMKHRQHHRGETLTNGSASPGCMKVGEAGVLNSILLLLYSLWLFSSAALFRSVLIDLFFRSF